MGPGETRSKEKEGEGYLLYIGSYQKLRGGTHLLRGKLAPTRNDFQEGGGKTEKKRRGAQQKKTELSGPGVGTIKKRRRR